MKHSARFSNSLASSGVHQSRRLPVGVELAALIVEPVCQLVAHDRPDGAVIHGRIQLLSKNGGCRIPAGKLMLFCSGL